MIDGIAILRVPSVSSERDPSSKAIGNLIAIFNDLSDWVLVFESQFDETEACVRNIPREMASNPLLNAVFLFLYEIRITYHLYRNREQLDAVFLHAGGFLFALPILYCKIDGISIIVSILGEPHKGYQNVSSGSLTDRLATRAVLYAERFAYSLADGLAVFSEDILTYEPISDYKSKCKRVRFNYEPVPDSVPRVSVRSNSIVYLGRICELKGSDRVFEAVEQLSSEMELDITASFVGDGNLLSQLRKRRDELELTNVELTGWVGSKTVDKKLCDSKILLLPSRSEGLPKALLEAMARGVVPVVTPVGNMPSVVKDGTNGILLDDPAPEHIAETVAELLESDRLSDMSDNARETIRREYGFDTAKSDFRELIRECET